MRIRRLKDAPRKLTPEQRDTLARLFRGGTVIWQLWDLEEVEVYFSRKDGLVIRHQTEGHFGRLQNDIPFAEIVVIPKDGEEVDVFSKRGTA